LTATGKGREGSEGTAGGVSESTQSSPGLVALFHGAAGTGKTLAAHVLAQALGRDILRVDLAQVVSKYIGETEKNLAALLDRAERTGSVLFLDEADALFGKRTDVKDAHDRYANVDIAYLLQRIEAYEGLVILATNVQDQNGEADATDDWRKRLRRKVRFPRG
jgi:SpoVK/Ycf46/Vps4 family AAA+-type ATPase